MRTRIYVGFKGGFREIFRSKKTPTEKLFPKYAGCVGPFRTVRGAKAMVHYGFNNPHCQTVQQAEKIGKKYADDLATKEEFLKLY